MATNGNGFDSPKADSSPLDLAQAFKEIQRGEQTAATLESNLSTLEAKLDAMLAGLEQQEGVAKSQDQRVSDKGGPETKAEEAKEVREVEREMEMDQEEDSEIAKLKKKQEGRGKGTFTDGK